MADLSKLRFNGTDYNVKDASAPTRKFTNTYSKTGNLPISSDDTTQTAIGKLENNIIPKSAKGTANGVAELDANGKVPSSQLPSYVDDVLEYSAKSSFPATGESGKIYVDTTTNKTYRWSGSAYVEISESLALGETDSTAYRGDRGKTAYYHSQLTSGNPHNVTKSDVGLGNVGNFKAVSTKASQGLSNTEKSNARANIGAGTGNGTYSKPSGGIPKSDLASAVQTSLDQVNTNKTNILYGLNTGVKNLLTIKPTFTINGLTSVQQSDGYTVKITGTPTGGKSIQWSNVIKITESGTYKVKLTLSGTMASCYLYDITTSTSIHEYYSSNTYDETLTANHEYAMYTYSQSAIDATISAMLCTAAAYAQSANYIAPALPNYDLTRLEAEDRASLAEVVDSGAKNVYNPANLLSMAYMETNGSDYAFKSSSTDSRKTFAFKVMSYNGSTPGPQLVYRGIESTGFFSCEFTKTSAFNRIAFGHSGSQRDLLVTIDVSNFTNNVTYVLSFNATAISPPTSIAFNNLMLCTKAAFGVSKAFVPYRPNYDLVETIALQNCPKFIEPCDFNTLVDTGYYIVNQSGSTNLPWSHGEKIFLQVIRFDPNNNQHLFQIGRTFNNPAAEYCCRGRYLGTWGSWYSYKGTAL